MKIRPPLVRHLLRNRLLVATMPVMLPTGCCYGYLAGKDILIKSTVTVSYNRIDLIGFVFTSSVCLQTIGMAAGFFKNKALRFET